MDITDPTRIERFLKALDPKIIYDYMIMKFGSEVVELGVYTVDNASIWIDMPELMVFAARVMQKRTTGMSMANNMPSSTPITTNPQANSQPSIPSSPMAAPGTPILMASVSSSPFPSSPFPSTTVRSSSRAIELSDSDSNAKQSTKTRTPSKKQKRNRLPESSSESGSDIEIISQGVFTPKSQAVKNRKKKKQRLTSTIHINSDNSDSDVVVTSDPPIRITRQLKVSQLITITTIPSTWTIIKGAKGAYLLDLRNDGREWRDASGELLSMAAIIKSQDQDAWGGGSAGHTQPSKCPSVLVLDGQKCQLAEHDCQGIYHCSELDMSLLDTCQRYAPDDDEMRDLFEAEREINGVEGSSLEILAAAFYKEAMKEPCKAVLDDGSACDGDPVYRRYKKQSHYGKLGFVGCT
ncbi:hypothetical protein CVT24_012477, partial [Panaeolus cyanescens]